MTVADPTYHTSRIHRHPPPRASSYCQENAESHLRCVRVDPSVASYLKDQISALVSHLSGNLSLSVNTVADALTIKHLLDSSRPLPAFRLSQIRFRPKLEWPHLGQEHGLPGPRYTDILGRSMESLLHRNRARFLVLREHLFNSSSCTVRTGAFICHEGTFEQLRNTAPGSKVHGYVEDALGNLRDRLARVRDDLDLLCRLRDVYARGESPLTVAEIGRHPAFERMVAAEVLEAAPSGRVILKGDYAAEGVLQRWIWDLQRELSNLVDHWLSEPVREVVGVPPKDKGTDRPPGPPPHQQGEEGIAPPKSPPRFLGENLVLGDRVSEKQLTEFARNPDLGDDGRRDRLASSGDAFYPLAVAATHTAIFGANGSGKSVTTKRLVRELVMAGGVPATIIDWHDEYGSLVREVKGAVAVPPTATVGPGADEIPFTWNVLDPRFYAEKPTREAEDYAQIVVDLMAHKKLMDLTEAMKCALTEALRQTYDRLERPTFKDVLASLDKLSTRGDTKEALKHRLGRFAGGSLGKIFCQETSLKPDEIFAQTLCVRVKHLTQDHQSAVGLLVFFLLRQAVSHFKRMGEAPADRPVRHVTVIDEAPMVLQSNPRVQQEVVRMVQEVRKFGEGLVLVCRNPGIDKEILRETNQKIAHRLEVPDDVRTVTEMLGLDHDQGALLRKLPRGVGFLRVGTGPPILVRFRSPAGP